MGAIISQKRDIAKNVLGEQMQLSNAVVSLMNNQLLRKYIFISSWMVAAGSLTRQSDQKFHSFLQFRLA